MDARLLKRYIISAITIVGIGLLSWFLLFSPPKGQAPITPGNITTEKTPVQHTSTRTDTIQDTTRSDNIIYATDMNADEDTFRSDCETKGGIFDSCGSPCAPDAEVCTTVCVLTCTLPE